ncbi:hypothetical protein [Corynebacterium sp. NML120713]|uniref:hypothetical protein n=1 Tax=Corynebacterium sp. NML120713 TaxID=1906332 RepID=UPI0008FAEF45|nr:hypothetical protein [Corynebacterium sp. NML120713]OIR43184.1 hypothetical protein BJP06_06285 [Corynebacterium sp. NML120713]
MKHLTNSPAEPLNIEHSEGLIEVWRGLNVPRPAWLDKEIAEAGMIAATLEVEEGGIVHERWQTPR